MWNISINDLQVKWREIITYCFSVLLITQTGYFSYSIVIYQPFMSDLSFCWQGRNYAYKFQQFLLIYEGILPKYNLDQEHIIVYLFFFYHCVNLSKPGAIIWIISYIIFNGKRCSILQMRKLFIQKGVQNV